MLPTSDSIEALLTRAKNVDKELSKRGSSQNIPTGLREGTLAVAREWLKVSPPIRAAGICNNQQLLQLDSAMQEIVGKATGASRASALRTNLKVLLEGGPRQ